MRLNRAGFVQRPERNGKSRQSSWGTKSTPEVYWEYARKERKISLTHPLGADPAGIQCGSAKRAFAWADRVQPSYPRLGVQGLQLRWDRLIAQPRSLL